MKSQFRKRKTVRNWMMMKLDQCTKILNSCLRWAPMGAASMKSMRQMIASWCGKTHNSCRRVKAVQPLTSNRQCSQHSQHSQQQCLLLGPPAPVQPHASYRPCNQHSQHQCCLLDSPPASAAPPDLLLVPCSHRPHRDSVWQQCPLRLALPYLRFVVFRSTPQQKLRLLVKNISETCKPCAVTIDISSPERTSY